MRWSSRFGSAAIILVASIHAAPVEATDYAVLPLHMKVRMSDAIVLGTVTDAERAVVRVDDTLKGLTERSFVLVRYVDEMNRVQDRRPLVTGTQELMFLNRNSQGYAPLQTQYGRWPVRDGRIEAPSPGGRLGWLELRETIGRLVRLQAVVEQGAADAMRAYVDGLQSSDPHVRLWAASTGYQRVRQPTSDLVDAYLKLWSARDGELRESTANAVIEWKVKRAAPMLATALREGAEPERQIAARALGGTGDRSFLPQLRAVAASDQSEKVRGRAFEGLTHLLGGASVSDLLNGAKDPSASVRRSVAIDAYNMARKGGDPEARSGTRRVLLLLSEDAAPDVRESARSWLKQLDSPH